MTGRRHPSTSPGRAIALAAALGAALAAAACGGAVDGRGASGGRSGGSGGSGDGSGGLRGGTGGGSGSGGVVGGTGGGPGAGGAGGLPGGDKRGEVRVFEGRYYYDDGGQITEQPGSLIEARFSQGAEPAWHRETMSDGACRLLTFSAQPCDPFCDGICLPGNQCAPWPTYVSAGTLTVTGLKVAVSLAPQGTSVYYGPSTVPPADLFDAGGAVTARASGGVVPAFTAEARGVARLEAAIQGGRLTLVNGQDYTLRWTPAAGVADARVRLTVNSRNSGHGQPYQAIIECDAPDSAGQLTVPRAMIDVFPDIQAFAICVSVDCPPSVLLRYTRGAAPLPGGGYVDLMVGDRSMIGVDHRR